MEPVATCSWHALGRDLVANRGNSKGAFVVGCYRLARIARGDGPRPRVWALPIGLAYRLVVEWILGVDLPWHVRSGPGLRIFHGVGLVVHRNTVIGADVTLRHCTTIGVRRDGEAAAPRLGDGVEIGSNSVVLGDITIGAGASVGAGSVLLDDVPPGGRALGAKARVVGP